MIILRLNRNEFEYDIQALVKAFYPRRDLKTVITEADDAEAEDLIVRVSYMDDRIHLSLEEVGKRSLIGCTQPVDYENRTDTKNKLKQELYRMLCKWTGRELPWGSLTGIRPTKIAVSMLEQGKSEEEIRQHMETTYFTSPQKTELAIEIGKRELKLLEQIDYTQGYSLYIGVPFCPTTCAYCSFTSYPVKLYETLTEPYVEALIEEMGYVSRACAEKKLTTVYIGGGTPTTLSPEQLDRLLRAVRSRFDFSHVLEFTVEAGRPDSITREKLEVLKNYGVTRISINPQSMNQKTLDIIGRKHTPEQIREAFSLARQMGFDNINMDIIVGLPDEGAQDVSHTLEEISKLKPDSLTVHSLAIKRAARLNTMKEVYADYRFENSQEIMEMTQSCARQMGLSPYYLYRQKNMEGNMENVGYAAEGKESLYNMLIMEEKQTILAVGAGAISKFVDYDTGNITRVANVKNVEIYIEQISGMIDRKRQYFQSISPLDEKGNSRLSEIDRIFQPEPGDANLVNAYQEALPENVEHGIIVSNLAFRLAKYLGYDADFCRMAALAGLVHDIGKLRLVPYLYTDGGIDTMNVKKIRYIRSHARLGYDILKNRGFPQEVLTAVLHHHENYDGSGFPDNLSGESIPESARILRICDVYSALTSDRTYRKAYSEEMAVRLMIDEIKNFDLRMFLAFQQLIHEEE